MKKILFLPILLFTTLIFAQNEVPIRVGAELTDSYFPLIKGKRIAVMTNQTGMAGDEHLVDLLVRCQFNIVGIFSPEHGFREIGRASCRERV